MSAEQVSAARKRARHILQALAPEASPPVAMFAGGRAHAGPAFGVSLTETAREIEDLGNGHCGGVHLESCAACPSRDQCCSADAALVLEPTAAEEDEERGPTGSTASGLRLGVDIESGPIGDSIKYSTPGLSKRAKSRLAGPSGNHWYALEIDANVAPGQVVGAVFWKTPIVLWRDPAGVLSVLEDRCAHRQLRLSKGFVENGNLTCCYHGWEYNAAGKVVRMAHEVPKTFASMPTIVIRSFPHKIKYGLIFVFPGDPALAESTPLPVIPWLDKTPPTPFRFVDMTVKAHWTLIIENNCDFYHAFLHRKYRPFWWPELQSVAREGNAVHVHYHTDMQNSAGARYLGSKTGRALDDMHLWFEYPLQRSNLVDKYMHWMFPVPIDERTTRTFYIFIWEEMALGPLSLPYTIRPPLLYFIHKYYLIPVLSQDLYALEEEQAMNDLHSTKASVELNPLVSAFQRLTLENWDAYLASERARRGTVTLRDWRLAFGAGLSDWRWADI